MAADPTAHLEALLGPRQQTRTAAADVASDPRPAAVCAPSIVFAPGDLVAAAIDGRVRLCAVQRVVKRDGNAIVRPLDELDRYWRLSVAQLTLCCTHGLLRGTYIP